MARKRIGLDYTDFELLTKQLKKMEGDVKKVTEEALKQSKRYVHQKLGQDMQRHNQTFGTIRSLSTDDPVVWVGGTKAEIPVGFSISEGGLASIFLMYGTPRMPKDQKIYNDIYGSKTSEEIADIQANVFFEAIGKLGG